MERKSKRTVTEVLDYETGECVDAELFFKKPLDEIIIYRSRLQQAIEEITDPLFGCYYCKQKIRIRGGISGPHKRKAEILHFAHLKDSEDCHIKTRNQLTKEEVDRIKYNGAKESLLHQTIKEQIAECLRLNEITKKEVTSVEVEKVIRDKVAKEWKKPDINAFFNNKRIAIELQLSTTWLNVITRRQHFYKEQCVFIFWVFHTFDKNDDVRKLTYNDVIYTNNQNAFVFNAKTYELSKSKNDLYLECYYKTYYREGIELCEYWDNKIIKLSDLVFDQVNYSIYYHDTKTEKKKVQQEIRVLLSEIENQKRLEIIKEQELERIQQEKLRIQKVTERNIEDLKDRINEVQDYNAKINKKEEKIEIEISDLIHFKSKSLDHTSNTFRYLANISDRRKPFYDYSNILESLEEEFRKDITYNYNALIQLRKEEEGFIKTLLEIKNLPLIQISGKNFSSICNTNNWILIKSLINEIKVINKKLANGLFAESELKQIKSESELNRFQYDRDTYFLVDFNIRITELEREIYNTREKIKQQETRLILLKDKVKVKIEFHVDEKISKLELEIKENSDKKFELDSKIENLKIQLSHYNTEN